MKTSQTYRPLFVSLLIVSNLGGWPRAHGGGVDYTVPGGTYSQNFDSLPSDVPVSATIQTTAANGYPNGWLDDSTTVLNDHVGLPGWYLYHPLLLAEGGTNGHQRIRFGAGANTGSFWGFRNSGTPGEIALGSIGSLTVAENDGPMYRALRLTNATGRTLTSFTVTFDGEQWRDGQLTTGETQTFGYSLAATTTDWFSTATFISVPALNFTSPVVSGISTAGTGVDGNTVGKVAGITSTISNVNWAPNTELWLRWNDPQLAGNADDGLAIDNVVFTATGPVPIADPKLTIGKAPENQYQLEWTGDAGFTYKVQHSSDLQEWIDLNQSTNETNGPMTFPLPADLLDDGRRYFRLKRVSDP